MYPWGDRSAGGADAGGTGRGVAQVPPGTRPSRQAARAAVQPAVGASVGTAAAAAIAAAVAAGAITPATVAAAMAMATATAKTAATVTGSAGRAAMARHGGNMPYFRRDLTSDASCDILDAKTQDHKAPEL